LLACVPSKLGTCGRVGVRQVDVWACGVTLFLLATGEVPFKGSSLINLFENIGRGEVDMPPRIRAVPDLADLVSKLLTVDHHDRMAVSEALAHK
jgi:serine/threonine protein kinase